MSLPIWVARAGIAICLTLLALLIPFSYNRLMADWHRVVQPVVTGTPEFKQKAWGQILLDAQRSYSYNTLDKSVLYDIGRAQIELRQYGDAVASIKEHLVAYPYSVNAWHNLATAHVLSGDLDQGLESFGQVFDLIPDFGPSHFYAAQVYEFKGELDAASSHYTLALKAGGDIKERAARRLLTLM